MSVETADLRIVKFHTLVPPKELNEAVHLSDELAKFVLEARAQAEAILRGEDDRLIVVVGPCSIHDPKAAVEYAGKLASVKETFQEDLHLIMRVYFEKPRTTVGWKGLINDPGMDNSFRINDGLRTARELLKAITELRVPIGTEFLDTIIPQYLADFITWGAIGARTTESQVHRELASGLSMPVGFKNGTGGSVQIAIDAIKAAASPHQFLSVKKDGAAAIFETTGNDTCHVILRGSSSGPNYQPEHVQNVVGLLEKNGLRPNLMVDCSHGNSQKDHRNQPAVAQILGQQIAGGCKEIVAVMIESHLLEGSQPMDNLSALHYGKSVTDACVSWETTGEMLRGLAACVRKRRG